MKEAIGGYFSLELPRREEYHKGALRLNTGRNSLEYILRSRKITKVYLPYYSCDVLLEPFSRAAVAYSFYHIDSKFEIAEDLEPSATQAILYVNYFGLKEDYVASLAERFGDRLIIDNTQAFFSKPFSGVDTFYSCRKFFGVPDGAYLYCEGAANVELGQDSSLSRMEFLMKRIDQSPEEGYVSFREESDSLRSIGILRMSRLTQRIMESIDYAEAAQARQKNFQFLDKSLSGINAFDMGFDDRAVPMVYPLLCDCTGLREYLISKRIFVPTYWPGLVGVHELNECEYAFVNCLLPLPVDQRYGEEEMKAVVKTVLEKVDCN